MFSAKKGEGEGEGSEGGYRTGAVESNCTATSGHDKGKMAATNNDAGWRGGPTGAGGEAM